ncbi:MAG: radical SAM protein [Deltaproteobacteria bacterium]|nr:radical SAM protein [Deltaproteobacteria bacterium]
MRVLLVSSNTERVNMVTMPVGLAMVACACRNAGHEVAVCDLLDAVDPVLAVQRAIELERPLVIGISVRNIDDQTRASPRFLLEQVRPVVSACQQATAVPIVLGGAGYSLFPDAALEYLGADFGVCGDGEAVFPSLLECIERGLDPAALAGVHARGRRDASPASFAESLDSLPCFDASLLRYARGDVQDLWVPVQSRRGCPNDCSYCATAAIQGRTIRQRSPAAVVDAIRRYLDAGFRSFYFVDNSFNIPERYALELCAALRALDPKPRWRCILYPHLIHEGLVRSMAEAGCVDVALGFESGNPGVLREMNKRYAPSDVAETSRLLALHGIRRSGFLLLGGPGESRASVEQSLDFAQSLSLDFLKITVGIRIYPGTRLAERAVKDGMLDPGDDLLMPRFYLAPDLEPWIQQRVAPSA